MEFAQDKLDLYLDAESIAHKVSRIADELDADSNGISLTVVGILKGSFIFLADLLRQIRTPVDNVEFLRMSSYGPNTVSSGDPHRLDDLSDIVVEGRHIVVIEDIIDTDITHLLSRPPKVPQKTPDSGVSARKKLFKSNSWVVDLISDILL